MRLRQKTVLIICAVLAALVAGLYGSARFIMLKSFERLERDQAYHSLDMAEWTLQRDLQEVDRFVTDWAVWDDSYAFMKDRNADYVQANLVDKTFRNNRLNLIALVDTAGDIIQGSEYSDDLGMQRQISESLKAELGRVCQIVRQAPQDSSICGLLTLTSGPMIIASHKILTSTGEGPPRGLILFGRAVDEDELQSFSEGTHLRIALYSSSDSLAPQTVHLAAQNLSKQKRQYFQVIDENLMASYLMMDDLLGENKLILQTTLPREVYEQGRQAALKFIISLIIAGLLMGAAILLLLERSILARLSGLCMAITDIRKSGDLAKRVPASGKDEIADLAGRINDMLSAVEMSKEETKRHAESLEKALQDLEIRENTLRNIFDYSPDGIAITDNEGKFIDCNRAALELHGCQAKSELIGHRMAEFVAPKEQGRFEQGSRLVAEKGGIKNLELTLQRRDGSAFPAEISVGLVKNEAGQPIYSVVIARDVSERKQAEIAVGLSEHRYKLLFERNAAGVYRCTAEGRLLEVNDSLLRILGFKHRNDLMACRVSDFYLNSSDREAFLQTLWSHGTLSNYEHKMLRQDGGVIWVLENASLILGDGDEPLVIQGTIIDITELKQTEQQLRESEAQYRRLYERNLAGVFRIAIDPAKLTGRRLDCNEAYAHLLGFKSREEILSEEQAGKLYHQPEDLQFAFDLLLKERGLNGQEIKLQRRDGSPVWAIVSATLSEGIEDWPYIAEGTAVDITLLKQAQQRERKMQLQLMEQNNLASMGLMAAGLAHNLNGPLQCISASIEMLQLMQGSSSSLDDILDQTNRLSAMVSNILRKTRQEQNSQMQELNLNKLLEQELEFLNSDLSFKHEVTKICNFDERLPAIQGIYSDFSQALTNIIRNALDALHGRADRILQIRTSAKTADELVIEVQDNGCGIAPQDLKRIFEPFFTTKPMAGMQEDDGPTGTGLGLSSTAQLLSKYGARFNVESELGQGTTVRVCLPLLERPQVEDVEIPAFDLEPALT